jgi:hypothetical protein
MQKDDVKLLYEWADTHGKCVRQRTVRQETTSYKCGTLPLNMYVSTSIEGTEVTFNHIDEYDESESDGIPCFLVNDSTCFVRVSLF